MSEPPRVPRSFLILDPCPESWSKMRPLDASRRHCDRCQREVTDLDALSTPERARVESGSCVRQAASLRSRSLEPLLAGVLLAACVPTDTSSQPPSTPAEPVVAESMHGPREPEQDAPAAEVLACDPPPSLPVTVVASMGVVHVVEGVEFAAGEDRVPESAHDHLREIAAVLEQFPDIDLRLTGHSDDREAAPSQLSQRRAQAVLEFLVDAGMDPGSLRAEGRGATEPLAANDSEEGRAKNRRVEFAIDRR